MQRVTMTFDDALMDDIDRFMAGRGYQNRSEAIRDLARAGLQQQREEQAGQITQAEPCVAALVYVYDHEVRALSRRLTAAQHDHHDLSIATLHVHLDSASCLEVAVLKGRAGAVRHVASHLTAERGVRLGRLVIIPQHAPTDAPDADHPPATDPG